jgi:transcriptional regulator with XRE-family HTH domain
MDGSLTQFGMLCREFRIRYRLKMGDQAKGLDISVAYISAIERGKRLIPEDYPKKLAEWLSLSQDERCALSNAATSEKTVVKVFPKNKEQALLAEDFAQNLNGLSATGVKQLRAMLATVKSGNYSDDEVRKRAFLARAVFDLGDQVSFDVLQIIENQLAIVDPGFSLQVDPDSTLGEYVQIFSDSDGESVKRMLATEWLYGAAYQGTDESRFKLAHELAHWMLHRREAHTFFRLSKPGTIVSKHVRIEAEADLFAFEFLMPLSVVEKTSSSELLARGAKVPLWAARRRMRQVEVLKSFERDKIKEAERAIRLAIIPIQKVPEVEEFKVQSSIVETDESTAGAIVLRFPTMPRVGNKQQTNKPRKGRVNHDLPLFDYADANRAKNEPAFVDRAAKWFSDFGWRG